MEIDDILKEVEGNLYSAFFYTPPFYKKSFSYLFKDPEEIISIKYGENLSEKFNLVENLINKGLQGYALLNYEAGYLFEKKLEQFLTGEESLLRFIFFQPDNVERISSKKIKIGEFKNDYSISLFHLNTSKEEYKNSIKKIKNFIEAGDTYQVNYTVKGKFNFEGSSTDFFKTMLFNQSAKYSAFINTGSELLISLSPELFFQIKNKKITAMPMKGTALRGIDHSDDMMKKLSLEKSEKNIAENLMIVDLLRNDLGRISKFGSVKTKEMFSIEKYETLFQMVSTIEANLNKNASLISVIKNIFPCGSVTGAPKMSTMKIINELEKENRGIYTGAIGFFNNNKAVFNVAIRTIKIDKGKKSGEIGLGSGIVWDSDPDNEYTEVLLKSNFLLNPANYFEIFETMLIERGEIFLLDDHLIRLSQAAEYFLFSYSEKRIRKNLEKILEKLSQEKKYWLKLIINKYGETKIQTKPLNDEPVEASIIFSDKIISTANRFQYFKTTNRNIYDKEYRKYSAQGYFDVIFINEHNRVAEGAISNIFIRKGDMWYTPPVNEGLLAGIYRKHFLFHAPNVKEEQLLKDDLLGADEIILTNSLRKEIRIKRLFINESEFKEFDINS
jgi:para-aminobenzoate synthetase / 4-amino-4-deoxychorismate lyase